MDTPTYHRSNIRPIGTCIYCGCTDRSLDEEHIVPFSMWGNLVLPAASCRKCAKITGKFEEICARVMFGDVRAQWRIFSRKKKDRKARFAAGLSDPLGVATIETTAKEKWFAPAVFPTFEVPSLISGHDKSDAIRVTGGSVIVLQLDENTIAPPPRHHKLALYAFSRMLAKIAYCACVADFGYENTPRDLVPYILGTDRCISHVVGEALHPFPPHPELQTDAQGKLTFERYRVEPGLLNDSLLVYGVQILRFLQSPTYWVVIGQATPYILGRIRAEGLPPVSVSKTYNNDAHILIRPPKDAPPDQELP